MHETDIHDLSDDADYAASQQQAVSSSMMASSSSRRRGSSGEAEGGEVVYVKDHVTIHPTQLASERISGRFMLFKHGSLLFMSWLPYKDQTSSARLSEKDMNLYSIRMVPFTEVRSIRRHTPALGWQYIIVVLSSGLAFPPLYFYSGGVREFLATVKRHVFLVRSAEDSNVFLLDDQNPLQKTLSSLELPRAVSVASGTVGLASSSKSLSKGNQGTDDGATYYESSSTSQLNRRHRPKMHNDPAHDLSIQLLEKFSLVTKFARETTSQLFGENHNNGFGSIERRSRNRPPHISPLKTPPPHISPQSIAPSHDSPEKTASPQNTASDREEVPDESPVEPDPLELDKLSLVWGKPRQSPLVAEEWAKYVDSEGRVIDSQALRKRIFYGGVEHNLRRQAWAFLLGYHAYDLTYAERDYLKSVKKSEYETIKRQWQSISAEQAKRFTKFRERKGLIEKDVVRTDRSHSFYEGDDNPNVKVLHDILLTYSFYNFDLGYCQGMSDLLSPILYVMGDESESFWCFVALMQRLGPNFNRDQSGMHSQLFALSKLVELLDIPMHNYFEQNDCLNYFFCFRWILIQFKREFEYEQTMRLWEVLWTHHLSEHLHLYVCVAILKRYRNKIMGERMDFDTLLKFINELSGRIDLNAILRDAEALCICAGENGAASIPPGTPPSLPVEDDLLYDQQDDVL